MPIKVKTPSEWGVIDDVDWVPSTKDFDALKAKVETLSQKVTSFERTLSSVKESVKTAESMIMKHADSLKAFRRDMLAELTDGDWKMIIDQTVSDAVRTLESTLKGLGGIGATEISSAVAKQMNDEQDLTAEKAAEEAKKKSSLKKVRSKRMPKTARASSWKGAWKNEWEKAIRQSGKSKVK